MQHQLTNLMQHTFTQLIQAIMTVPIGVTSLDLRWNGLYNKTGTELAEAFAAIPKSVISLDLSRNDLDKKNGSELAQALTAIPENVTSLDLSANGLYNKTGAELAQALTAIPKNVISLNLRGNGLQKLSVEELNKLNNSLPWVQTIYLCETEIKAMTTNQRAALKAVFPTIQNIILVDDKWNALGDNNMEACHYFASQLELTKEPPSLKSYAAFFVKHHMEPNKYIEILPKETQEFVNNF